MADSTGYLWLKTLHVIFMVAWFSGLFYLPRLFVYHTHTEEPNGYKRFNLMEWRLYYAITWPAGVVTTLCGIWMLYLQPERLAQPWLYGKLALVACLWVFHISCGYYLRHFQQQTNPKSETFYRCYNEFPTVILCLTIYLIMFKPSFSWLFPTAS